MPILLEADYRYQLPRLERVRQHFDRSCIKDIDTVLEEVFKKSEIKKAIQPGARVAIAVGSRGIQGLQHIVKSVVADVLEKGGSPYIVSAMGSHGNGTEEGQRDVLASYGITEEKLGIPVVTTVEVEAIGETPNGKTVYFDKSALKADVVIPINRVKLHTDFVGQLQSGLCKMLVIGLGNQIGCSAIHEEDPETFASIIEEAANVILERCNVAYGIAIIENAYDKTFLVEAIPKERLIEREKELVEIAKTKMPTLMVPEIDVLIVEEIGKNISGAGYDPNILGKSSVLKAFLLEVPKIEKMVLLGVTQKSHGNAIGIGMFDVVTKNAVEDLDYEAMYANAIACKCIDDVRIPLVAKDEDEAVRVAVKCIRNVEKEALKIVKIKNTLELEYIEVSEAVKKMLVGNERISFC